MEDEQLRRLKSYLGLLSCSNDTLSSANIKIRRFKLNFSSDLIVYENINYIEQVIKYIEKIKEGFLGKYLEGSKHIEYEMKKIYSTVQMRKAELEARMLQMANSRISSWDKQLKICEEAEDWLKNIKIDSGSFVENLFETCNMYANDIGFINSSEISFDGAETAVNYFLSVERSNAVKIMPKICFGIEGQDSKELKCPWGICTDITGRILIADSCNNRIQIFNDLGEFLLQFGKKGSKAREFNKPVGITVDKKCRIIIIDRDNHRVQIFTYTGGFIFMFGKKGTKPGQFHHPWGVDTNEEGDMAISDTNNHRVQLFTKNGMFLSEFVFDHQISRLHRPVCPVRVAFKPDGTLLVTDFNNDIIFKIDEEFSKSLIIEDYKAFCKPQGIACNSKGVFMVADTGFCKIQIFDIQEKPCMVFGVPGKNLGEFDNPQGICFHPNGSIVVGDFGNNRIQVFDFPLHH